MDATLSQEADMARQDDAARQRLATKTDVALQREQGEEDWALRQ